MGYHERRKSDHAFFSHAAVGYGEKTVLRDVSFQVNKGEYVALIGSNGTGKSTLIKCVSGLLPLNSGEIEILLDIETKKTVRLKELVPNWRGYDRFRE